jgi:hypothetical protein
MKCHSSLLAVSYILLSHSTNIYSNQVQNTKNRQENLLQSLQYELKDPSYRTTILPNNFNYLSQLLALGNKNGQPPAYARSVIKLFSNLLKSAEYVNAQALEQCMSNFSELVEPYFSLTLSRTYITHTALYDAHMFDRFKETVNNALYHTFSTEYESFRADPAHFLNSLSNTIVVLAQEEVTREQIRHSIMRFAEIALSKCIWDIAAPEKSWLTTKKIADHLATLLERNILEDTNDLDDLYWSLLTRYCYFIDIMATDLEPSFYIFIKNDIAAQGTILFDLPEQDSFVESKLSYMQRTLLKAESQSRAYHMNIAR